MLIVSIVISLFFLFLLIGIIFFLVTQLVDGFIVNAPFVPIPKDLEKEIVPHLHLSDSSVLYDLGCGDGRVLLEAVNQYPKIKAVGIEIATWPYLLAKLKSRKYKNVEIRKKNIFTTNIADATHIFLYLYPKVINKLIKNIETQCRPGTIIVSCDFELTERKPDQIINTTNTANPVRGKKLFIYTL
jgi:hypothetical protein